MFKTKIFVEDNLIWNKKTFPNKLNPNEDIVLVVREDIFIIALRGLGYFLIFCILMIIRLVLAGISNQLIISLYDIGFFTTNSILILLFAYNFHNYYLSLQIVTDQRLIDIDQTGLFNREVNELSIERIEDVTYKQNGILPAIFGYGSVSVQSAAEISGGEKKNDALTGGFVFENVPQPAEIHAIITDLYHKNRSREAHYKAQLQAQYLAKVVDKNQVNDNFYPENSNYNHLN
jgi:uncharacterized membrane protein YdbT with pleckstrin-like domain